MFILTEIVNTVTDVTCGGMTFDPIIPKLVSSVVKLIQFGIPVVLIIFGMIDLGRAVMSNDEKEMKGAQGKLIRRVVYAVLIFLIVAIVKLVFGILDTAGSDDFTGCINCFVSGECHDANDNDGEDEEA